MASITRQERLQAAISGDLADRPPIALWRHFPVDDQDPGALAESSLRFQEQFDLDFLKITPASSYCVRDWGVEDQWRGSAEGTRDYIERAVRSPADWQSLHKLDAERGALGEQLQCVAIIAEALEGSAPFIQTIFSPLAQAKNLAGQDRLLVHLHQDPAAVLAGLETITQTTIDFIERLVSIGVAGIFYAVQHASYLVMDRDAYLRFGTPFDLRILEAAAGLWLNVLHLHGEALIFEVAEQYPAAVVNWHDRTAGPSLAEARRHLPAAVCGGLRQWDTLTLGDPHQVLLEAQQAIASVPDGGLILGAGCVVPILAPDANLAAARAAVDPK